MNDLSWILYGIEIAGNVRFLSVGALIMGGACCAFCGLWLIIESGISSDENSLQIVGKGVKNGVVALCIGSALLVIVPSKDTMRLIAMSQIGESVFANGEVQELTGEAGALARDSLKLLRQVVTDQLGSDDE